jgi:amino acid permease
MNKALVFGAIILGIVFLILTVIYFITPANSLPSFLPGFDPTLTKTHYKHGIGSLVIALGLLALAWFKSAKKSTKVEPQGN